MRWGEVAQSCPTFCDPMDCNLLGFSIHGILIHGILQARILEWIAISFSRGSSRPRDRTWVSCIGGRRFNLWATMEANLFVVSSSLEWDDLNSIVIWICSNALLPHGELRVLFFPPQFYCYHIWILQNLFTQHHDISATQISTASVFVLFSLFVYTCEYIN